MAYKMKHTDGKKASPAKFAAGMLTKTTLDTLKKTALNKTFDIAKKKVVDTVKKKAIDTVKKKAVDVVKNKAISIAGKTGGSMDILKSFNTSPNLTAPDTKAFTPKVKPKADNVRVMTKTELRDKYKRESPAGIKAEKKRKKQELRKEKRDALNEAGKQTFGQKLIDQGLSTAGDFATHVATQALTPKEEKVVNPADNFSQMRFGNYPSQS